MKRRLVGLVLALVLALVGTGLLVAYAQSARTKVAADEQQFDVLVATKPIPAGTPASALAASVQVVHVPASSKVVGGVTSLAELGQRVATVDVLPGEQLVATRFAAAVPKDLKTDGKLQVTVTMSSERALGGRLRVGDTVGVVVTVDDAPGGPSTHLIVHKAPITALQATAAPGAQAQPQAQPQPAQAGASTTPTSEPKPAAGSGPTAAPTGQYLVTLALDAPDVERVVYAAEHAKMWLTIEPDEANSDGTRVVTKGSEL